MSSSVDRFWLEAGRCQSLSELMPRPWEVGEPVAVDGSTPQQLRDEWRYYDREHRKQQVVTDVMTAFSRFVDEAIARGSTSVLPGYGSPELVAEALHGAVDTQKGVEEYFGKLASDACEAFNAAVQRN